MKESKMTELQIATKAVQLYAETHPRPIDVTQKQAAQMLNRSEPTIKKLIEAGTIKLNIDGRIPITEIDKFSQPKAA